MEENKMRASGIHELLAAAAELGFVPLTVEYSDEVVELVGHRGTAFFFDFEEDLNGNNGNFIAIITLLKSDHSENVTMEIDTIKYGRAKIKDVGVDIFIKTLKVYTKNGSLLLVVNDVPNSLKL